MEEVTIMTDAERRKRQNETVKRYFENHPKQYLKQLIRCEKYYYEHREEILAKARARYAAKKRATKGETA